MENNKIDYKTLDVFYRKLNNCNSPAEKAACWDEQNAKWKSQGHVIKKDITFEDTSDHQKQVEFVRQSGYNITKIPHPCDEAKLEACKNIYNIRFIENPTKEMFRVGMENLKKPLRQKNGRRVTTSEYREHTLGRRLAILAFRDHSFYKTIGNAGKKEGLKAAQPLIKMRKDIEDEINNESSTDLSVSIMQLKEFYESIKIVKEVTKMPAKILKVPSTAIKFASLLFDTIFCEVIYGIKPKHVEIYKTSRCSYENMLAGVIRDIKK